MLFSALLDHHLCSLRRVTAKVSGRSLWLATMMGGLALVWVFWGTESLGLPIAFYVLGAALVVSILVGLVALRRSPRLPARFAPPNWRIYFLSVLFEAVAIPISASLLIQYGQQRFILPVIAIIVGTHFFWLTLAFHDSLYIWIGVAMCSLAVVSLMLLPSDLLVGSLRVNVCALAVGVGCAITLWLIVLLRA